MKPHSTVQSSGWAGWLYMIVTCILFVIMPRSKLVVMWKPTLGELEKETGYITRVFTYDIICFWGFDTPVHTLNPGYITETLYHWNFHNKTMLVPAQHVSCEDTMEWQFPTNQNTGMCNVLCVVGTPQHLEMCWTNPKSQSLNNRCRVPASAR